MSAFLWALQHPANRDRRLATMTRWAAHNVRRRIGRGREVTVTFAGTPLRGPIGHPIINLVTYVQGGFYDYDAMTSLTILLEPGQTFIDVGANIGPYSVLAAGLVGATGQIVAVEPSADQLSYLRRNLCDLPVETVISTVPLADRVRVTELIEEGPTIQHLVEAVPSDGEARTSTLDAELARLGGHHRGGFAKIDVEGWEPAVIAGARAWLASRPIGLLVEANGLNHRSPVSWEDSVRILRALAYEYTWPDFSRRVLHVFADPGPVSPFGDYLVLASEAIERLQRKTGLRILRDA
jgi:FkbM family methyltransferase